MRQVIESIIGVVVGLAAGYALRYSPKLVPESYADWAGESVASSQIMVSALAGLQLDGAISTAIHEWLIVSVFVSPAVILVAVVAGVANVWLRSPNAITISTLVMPILFYLSAIQTRALIAREDEWLANSWWNNQVDHFQGHLLCAVPFVLAFSVLNRFFKPYGPVGGDAE